MPKTTTSHAAKLYRSLAKAYDALADIFQEGIVNETDASTLIAEANAGAQVWQDVSVPSPPVVTLVLMYFRTRIMDS